MDRITLFKNLEKHAWYGKQYKSLSKKYIDFCIDFITKNNELDKHGFAFLVNRMFMDCNFSEKPKAEQKRLRICQELISCSNSI